ncbi:putative tyrosine-protein phosphatase [Aaosphaeria arxii CBS 175.79]|uniref:Putative tyrosine-protein phosphatase n=1 Tax=Aaosphaeria arxii CBS 175.79 TaxID=1450172 RepID=A0A6A5Y8G8_9PLEO|nr:putative tyrosine-protein phosphatase [Aaosphaeria arxii CBS 175.79]KAF2021688.1 putative tyrosine-protein phosphatase [Aaosphaeria arxii CBS 175.79]
MHSVKSTEVNSPETLSPRPAPPDFFPFYIVPGISNFRDIGGWPSATGQIRKGILYRGSDTNRVQPDGIVKLQGLGIKTDFDLRSKQQIEKTGGYKEIDGIERKWTPVFNDEQYTEEAARKRYELYAGEGADGIVEAFVEILTSGAQMFGTVLRQIIATVPTPTDSDMRTAPALFMHCTTGNNRTGVFIALLLLLLDVPTELVVNDYTLSEQGLAPTRHINVDRLLKKGAFEEYGPDEARRKCERMVGARAESMLALVEEVDRRWGGPKGYFKQEVGLGNAEVQKLRDILIVPAPSVG